MREPNKDLADLDDGETADACQSAKAESARASMKPANAKLRLN